MAVSVYYSGDTAPFVVTCGLGTKEYPIDSATDTVKAAFVNPTDNALITLALSQSNVTAGADWPVGNVAVQFDATEAAKLAAYANTQVILEIEVTKPVGKQTFQALYAVRKGAIA